MTTQTNIANTPAAPITADIQLLPLADTYLSEHNPRGDIEEGDEGIAEMAKTMVAAGLIHNLIGLLDDEGKAGIVAGGRRWRALQIAVKERPDLANIPVKTTRNLETALSWAMLENRERQELDKVDEIRAYGQSRDKGLSLAQIAQAYCVTEAHVRRRIALADLPAPVLDALKTGDIGLGEAKVFARSDDEAKILKVLEQALDNHWWGEYQIKQALEEDKLDADCRTMRFIGLDAYKDAGGTVTTNLFDDDATVDDTELLDRLFAEKLEREAAKLQKAERLAWVQIVDDSHCHVHDYLREHGCARLYPIAGELSEGQQARFDELDEKYDWELTDEEKAEKAPLQDILNGDYSNEQRALSGAIVYVNSSGNVASYLGIVSSEHLEKAVDAGFVTPSQHDAVANAASGKDAAKSPISQKLADDLSRISRGAKQHAALRDPDLLIDLLAYQLSHNLCWRHPLGISLTEVPNWPTTEAEGYELDERLTNNSRDMHDAKDLCASFRAFRKKGADHIKGELVRFLAAQYQGGDAKLAELVTKETKPNIREVWTPTAKNFFGRVGGPYLVEIWCDLLDLSDDHPTATEFAKLKKSEKAEKLEKLFSDADLRKAYKVTDEQAAKIDAWLPEGME